MPVVTAKSEPLSVQINPARMIRCLWQHRELILQLTARDIALRYRGTYLGVLWSFISPLLMLVIYTFVFSVIFHAKWNDAEQVTRLDQFALTLFAGLIPFTVFAEVVNRTPTIILSVPNYVKKVVFPLEVLPVMVLGSAVVHSLISTAILVVGTALFQGFVSPTVALLPFAFLPLILLCLGLSWFIASLGVYVRDIGQSIGLVVQMFFFLSPIFYPIAAVPEPLRFIFHINPLTTIVDGFRQTLLWQEMLSWEAWGQWVAILAILAWLGYVWFMKTKRGFADVM